MPTAVDCHKSPALAQTVDDWTIVIPVVGWPRMWLAIQFVVGLDAAAAAAFAVVMVIAIRSANEQGGGWRQTFGSAATATDAKANQKQQPTDAKPKMKRSAT